MMKYDVIIIGAGSGGLNVAGFMNRVGLKVLLIDKRSKNIGGDCLNFGCIPSKALVHVSRKVHAAREAGEFGFRMSGEVDMKKVVRYIGDKKRVIRAHENADYFKRLGMSVILGEAKFSSRNSVVVKGKEYFGKRIVIATGSRPRMLDIKGMDNLRYGENYFNNENIFDLKSLPKRLVVVGGGPIGIEIGQALSRLGSRVTILVREDRFLPKEDAEISQVLLEQLKKEGVDFKFNTSPLEILKGNRLLVKEGGVKKKISYDGVFVAIGRKLNLDLDLDEAGIELEKDDEPTHRHDSGESRVRVDKYLRTTNKKIYVCGDVSGGYQFTHMAELHASIILNNFFSPLKKSVNYDDFSWVTFSDPEIATFGLNGDELRKRGTRYERLSLDFEDDDRAIVNSYTEGKMILNVADGKLLGGSVVAPNAGEMFQELVLLKSSGLDVKDIFNKIYAYPTASRVNKAIVTKLFSRKLTGFNGKILRFFYSFA